MQLFIIDNENLYLEIVDEPRGIIPRVGDSLSVSTKCGFDFGLTVYREKKYTVTDVSYSYMDGCLQCVYVTVKENENGSV